MDQLTGRGDLGWLVTATREISHIRNHLILTTDRDFARVINMNPRTVAKLRPEHPDPTLQYKTVDRMFKQLEVFLYEDGKVQSEEYLMVAVASTKVYKEYRDTCHKQGKYSKKTSARKDIP